MEEKVRSVALTIARWAYSRINIARFELHCAESELRYAEWVRADLKEAAKHKGLYSLEWAERELDNAALLLRAVSFVLMETLMEEDEHMKRTLEKEIPALFEEIRRIRKGLEELGKTGEEVAI